MGCVDDQSAPLVAFVAVDARVAVATACGEAYVIV